MARAGDVFKNCIFPVVILRASVPECEGETQESEFLQNVPVMLMFGQCCKQLAHVLGTSPLSCHAGKCESTGRVCLGPLSLRLIG